MYHDLDPEKRPLSRDKNVVSLLASTGSGDCGYAETYSSDDPDPARKVPWVVMDADTSQYSALVDAASSKNLAIEGPPGSGKSQTIVNLIACAIADGKKVLFVAENSQHLMLSAIVLMPLALEISFCHCSRPGREEPTLYMKV